MTSHTTRSLPVRPRTAGSRTAGSRSSKIAVGALAGLALALGAPLAASAHVTVSPDQADAGAYALLAFRVPNESDTAGTVGLTVDLPQDTPFAYVSTEPIPGWTAEIEEGPLAEPVDVDGAEVTEAALRIVWTADPGTQIDPGEFQRFAIVVGPVPDTGSVTLGATQTYSDGEVVEWTDTEKGAEYPAPVLYVGDAPAGSHHSGTADEHGAEDSDAAAEATATSSDDGLARGLGIGGLVLGALGAVLGAYAAFGRRRTKA